ncbi:MAG: energy-coupling factor transporter transmembrane protein EcfT [Firmicutes bacterium]|jgi:energy-coupling factor transport system permease protein|nr:energy-coupling factor transporter transmembrane protein EcfT [Bacillota bacterium]
MLRDITIGQYYPADSPIHRLDPRTKILSTILYIILIFTLSKMIGYGLIAVFILAVIKMSKVPAKFIFKGLRPILLIIIFAFLINMLMTPGETIYKLWIFDITREGFRQAFFMVFRLIFLIIGTSVLTLTTSPILLTDGIEKLLNVFKKIGVPAHELAMMMTIALRFIPTLLEETDKIMKAQMARGADFETGNLVNRAKSLIPILVPLFISAFRRADDLAMAMEARCYRGGENRTRMKVLKYSSIDIVALIFMIILTGAHIAVKILA